MSKKRAAVRYTAAGVVTTLYAAAAYVALTRQQEPQVLDGRKVALTAGAFTALTWIAATA